MSTALCACTDRQPSDNTKTASLDTVPTAHANMTAYENNGVSADTISRSTETKVSSCDCSTKQYLQPQWSTISFQPSGKLNKEDQATFEKWSNDSLRLTVTSLKFYRSDTIPDKFKVFENVEQVILKDVWSKDYQKGKSIYGLDIFPKLKTVVFWGCSVTLDPTAKWLKRIEKIYAEKTNIAGMDSFSATPDLHELYMAFSGFNVFPKNIESLKCLSKVTFGAYTFGNINLADIDVSKLPCLQYIEFLTWTDNMTGIPVGIETSSLKTVKIHHQKLTDKEKEIIKKANSQTNK